MAALEGARQVIAVVAARAHRCGRTPPGPGPPWPTTPLPGEASIGPRPGPRPPRPAGAARQPDTPARVRNTPGRIGGPSRRPPGGPSAPRITGALAPAFRGTARRGALRPV